MSEAATRPTAAADSSRGSSSSDHSSTGAALRRIARRLAETCAPEAALLYGSQAWGTPHPRHSDADLFVIKSDVGEGGSNGRAASRAERSARVETLLKGTHPGLPLDVLVLTPSEVAYRLERGDRFVARILREGRVLCEQTPAGGAPSVLQRLRQKTEAMPPPAESDYPHEWIETAEKDWKRAEALLGIDDPEGAAFHLQQAVEKFLKAFLLSKGWTLRKTHNLSNLLEEAAAHDASLANFEPACRRVTKFYFTDRYPALPGEEREAVDTSEAGVRGAREQVEPLIERLRRGTRGAA